MKDLNAVTVLCPNVPARASDGVQQFLQHQDRAGGWMDATAFSRV